MASTAVLAYVLLALPAWQVAQGQSVSANYQIPRQTVDAGGNAASSTSFQLVSSIGQPDAGAGMSSGSYRLSGGFHRPRAGEQVDRIFSDRFQPP